ncbi:PAS domain-containing sensor histidine kinase [Arenibaculum sp.]|jgi:PAS domain S-box-containing protein|uniref:PAS domain-containing sensor histidine kinase n=1 Tax=Arenibaculum sp. TaxID=2865862 RepID=UPI002E11C1C4|nr:ATP-binding protein [Arenibaculum sp.]
MAASGKTFELVFGESPDAVVVAAQTAGDEGSASAIDYVNPAFAALTGWPAEALRGRPMDLLEPSSGPASARPWADRMQALLRRSDGSRMPVEVARHPIRDAAGGVCQMLHVLRVRMEDAGRAADLLPAAVALVRPDLSLGYANREFEAWFSCRREDVVGRPFADATGRDFYARIHADLDRARAGSPVDLQETYAFPAGRCRHLRLACRPMADQPGTVCAFMLDVTEMETARRKSDAANRAKSEFLAHMSHELRTPLNAVMGFAEMIRGELFGPAGHPKYAEYATDILASGRHLLDLVSDLIDIGRIETGKVETHPGQVDLASVAEGVRRLVGPEARMRGISVTADIPAGLPPLWADERAVRQILLNLLSNAVKYGEAGGEAMLSARLAEDADGMLEIMVQDTGIGMRQEDLERIGQPFFRLAPEPGAEPDSVPEGSGIGLYVTKSLVELNGGSITFESRPGVGTTVRVRLPATLRNADPRTAGARAPVPSPGPGPVPHRAAE